VWLRWLFWLSGGGGGWVVFTGHKQSKTASPRVEAGTKKRDRGDNQGAMLGAALHDRCGSCYCTRWEVEVGVEGKLYVYETLS